MEQIGRFTERTMRKTDTRKEITLQVGNKVNSYQSRLREASRKMMAISSELAVQQVGNLHVPMLEIIALYLLGTLNAIAAGNRGKRRPLGTSLFKA